MFRTTTASPPPFGVLPCMPSRVCMDGAPSLPLTLVLVLVFTRLPFIDLC